MSKSVTVKTREELMKALADEADEIRIENSRRTLAPFKPATLALVVPAFLILLFGNHIPILLFAAGVAFCLALGLNLKGMLSMPRLLRYKTVERGRDSVVVKRR